MLRQGDEHVMVSLANVVAACEIVHLKLAVAKEFVDVASLKLAAAMELEIVRSDHASATAVAHHSHAVCQIASRIWPSVSDLVSS